MGASRCPGVYKLGEIGEKESRDSLGYGEGGLDKTKPLRDVRLAIDCVRPLRGICIATKRRRLGISSLCSNTGLIPRSLPIELFLRLRMRTAEQYRWTEMASAEDVFHEHVSLYTFGTFSNFNSIATYLNMELSVNSCYCTRGHCSRVRPFTTISNNSKILLVGRQHCSNIHWYQFGSLAHMPLSRAHNNRIFVLDYNRSKSIRH